MTAVDSNIFTFNIVVDISIMQLLFVVLIIKLNTVESICFIFLSLFNLSPHLPFLFNFGNSKY